ncbi:Nucleolar protein 12 [Zancudomyces culisetae]|uniref:Nucleolar protein 12 n=1 Tax=Zancudomyces culisetae TaxID=1213189 RepID=A0A1R1PRL0_ZANCU|nr:Nucleolar protein 12 [Zancudomyces culisetae]|eukprot:OMH83597.1 Nucleolar protein 12 [Zancudomyces culisetae]
MLVNQDKRERKTKDTIFSKEQKTFQQVLQNLKKSQDELDKKTDSGKKPEAEGALNTNDGAGSKKGKPKTKKGEKRKLEPEQEKEERTSDKKRSKEAKEDSEKSDENENEESATDQIEEPESTKDGVKETEAERKAKNERTVFIGNITVKILKDKKMTKNLKDLFKECGKVESIRFRSIGFSVALNKRVAVIKDKYHSERDTCNGYLVMESVEAAKKCTELNGIVFEERHLRVDLANNSAKDENTIKQNKKRTVFIGNLKFDCKEEELYKHFEKCGEIENVRVVRDSATGMGKGIAYITFRDISAVPLALELNKSKLPTENEKASREMRVSRYKASMQNAGDKMGSKGSKNTNKKTSGKFLEGARSVRPTSAKKGDKKSGAYRRIKSKKNNDSKRQ